MPGPTPLRSCVTLAHLTVGNLVQVERLCGAQGVGAEVPSELRVGEVVQCLRKDLDGVLIARGDGSRILVPLRSAREVEVRWFPESLEDDGEAAEGPSYAPPPPELELAGGP